MNKPKISFVVAMAQDRAIGGKNELLWHIPKELKRFKEITTGHPIIMGRKTHQSIGRPLPDRTNIIITKDPEFKAEGCIVVHSLEEAVEKAKEVEKEEIYIIGGGQIFEQAMPIADKLYLTIVEGEFPQADIFFPEYSDFKKQIFEKEAEDAGYKFKFFELERV